jgi:hypothetical protein
VVCRAGPTLAAAFSDEFQLPSKERNLQRPDFRFRDLPWAAIWRARRLALSHTLGGMEKWVGAIGFASAVAFISSVLRLLSYWIRAHGATHVRIRLGRVEAILDVSQPEDAETLVDEIISRTTGRRAGITNGGHPRASE